MTFCLELFKFLVTPEGLCANECNFSTYNTSNFIPLIRYNMNLSFVLLRCFLCDGTFNQKVSYRNGSLFIQFQYLPKFLDELLISHVLRKVVIEAAHRNHSYVKFDEATDYFAFSFNKYVNEEKSSLLVCQQSEPCLDTLSNESRYICNLDVFVYGLLPLPLEKRWCLMLCQSIYECIQLEVAMSWLSTLGGGFSALGDHSLQWADKAAAVSTRQLLVAWRIGDPALIARCRLYAAIALIQKRKYKAASRIIKSEYTSLRRQSPDVRDTKLVKMCQGIWTKLLYTKSLDRIA